VIVRQFRSYSLFIILSCGLAAGCTSPGYESASGTSANPLLISSVIDKTNQLLNSLNCAGAYATVYPIYNSVSSNNGIRLAMASTYGCYSGVNVFKNIGDLVAFGSSLNGSGLWEFMAQEFPSSATPTDDKVPTTAEYGIDAIQATIGTSVIPVAQYMINATGYNPSTLLYTDRTNDANTYLTFLAMALMGSLENRYGVPTANHHKSTALPWTSASLTAGDGCAFTSAILNFYDGIQYLAASAPANVASKFSAITSLLNTGLNLACTDGCLLCGGSVSCTSCPTTMRSRASCTGTTTDVNSCAAAGIVTFVNSSWTGPP
jgi:hypothetical protein